MYSMTIDYKFQIRCVFYCNLMVLSELSLLTMLQRALLCPSCGQTDDSGHVSDHKWHNTKCIWIYIIFEIRNQQFFNYTDDDHYKKILTQICSRKIHLLSLALSSSPLKNFCRTDVTQTDSFAYILFNLGNSNFVNSIL